MRIEAGGATFDVVPDNSGPGWIVYDIRIAGEDAQEPGAERKANPSYLHHFPSALREVLNRALKLSLSPDATLTEAVATVATLYAAVHEGGTP